MEPFPIVVLASGSGGNLQAILDRLHMQPIAADASVAAAPSPDGEGGEGAPGIEVVGVGSDKPEARALQRATRAGVETAVFPAEQFEGDRDARDRALGDWIESRGARLVVLAGYMQLLSLDFVRRFHGRLINVHPSLLPAFPGLDAIGQALDYGVAVTGVTVHYVDEGVDTGPIIAQRPVPVPTDRNRTELELAIHAVEHELLPEVISMIASEQVSLGPGRTVTISGQGK